MMETNKKIAYIICGAMTALGVMCLIFGYYAVRVIGIAWLFYMFAPALGYTLIVLLHLLAYSTLVSRGIKPNLAITVFNVLCLSMLLLVNTLSPDSRFPAVLGLVWGSIGLFWINAIISLFNSKRANVAYQK